MIVRAFHRIRVGLERGLPITHCVNRDNEWQIFRDIDSGKRTWIPDVFCSCLKKDVDPTITFLNWCRRFNSTMQTWLYWVMSYSGVEGGRPSIERGLSPWHSSRDVPPDDYFCHIVFTCNRLFYAAIGVCNVLRLLFHIGFLQLTATRNFFVRNYYRRNVNCCYVFSSIPDW